MVNCFSREKVFFTFKFRVLFPFKEWKYKIITPKLYIKATMSESSWVTFRFDLTLVQIIPFFFFFFFLFLFGNCRLLGSSSFQRMIYSQFLMFGLTKNLGQLEIDFQVDLKMLLLCLTHTQHIPNLNLNPPQVSQPKAWKN